jgi:uncharacterized protein (DUF488 family)
VKFFAAQVTFYTIGHSTRTLPEFLALLRVHGIAQIADVRTVPRSRRHPHFAREALAASLAEHGIAYEHFAELGGLRRPRRDSPNRGWRNKNFRGYADYMQTSAFEAGVARLLEYGATAPTAAMCAEAVWWRCHRGLLADALLVRGVTVRHIISSAPAQPHQLCDFATTEGTTITYR